MKKFITKPHGVSKPPTHPLRDRGVLTRKSVATDQQIACLRRLGYKGSVQLFEHEAEDLIALYKSGRGARRR